MPSQDEYARRSREMLRRFNEAIEAARSAAPGMSRGEVRQRVVAELRARGIVVPPPTADLIVHDIMLGTGAAGGIRRSAWHLANAADLAGRGIRFLSAAVRHQPLPRWDLLGVRHLKPDLSVQEDVILDPAAQESLTVAGTSFHDEDIAIFGGDVIEVWLSDPGSGRGPASDGADSEPPAAAAEEPLVVYYGEDRVGVLGPGASNVYRQAVRDAHDAGVIPVLPAVRRQADDGLWHLRLGAIPRSYRDKLLERRAHGSTR